MACPVQANVIYTLGPFPNRPTRFRRTAGAVHYLTCAVWYNYAAALSPLGHWTLTSIALLYLHHPVVALVRMKQFKSDYDLQYSTGTDLEADVDRQADSEI
jgi:hypothetical protein